MPYRHNLMRPVTFAAFILLCLLPLVAAAQDTTPEPDAEATEEPVIPYFNSADSARRFNIPIPAGWDDRSTDSVAHFTNGDLQADIYATAVDGEDAAAGIRGALAQLDIALSDAPRQTVQVQLSGLNWEQHLYDLPDGGTLTAFARVRDSVVYVLAYANHNPDSDFYMLVTRPSLTAESDTLENGVARALNLLYPDLDPSQPETSETVALSNGDWTRLTYTLPDGEPLAVLAQLRSAGATYVVIEQGTAGLVDSANKVFFSQFLGFFVTPQTDDYLYLGLGAIAAFTLLLIASIIVRRRSLSRDEDLIHQLESDESAY